MKASLHAGPPSFSPPPLPPTVQSNGLTTNEQDNDAFNDTTNGYNSIENEEAKVTKHYNGDVTETANLLSDMKNIMSNNLNIDPASRYKN